MHEEGSSDKSLVLAVKWNSRGMADTLTLGEVGEESGRTSLKLKVAKELPSPAVNVDEEGKWKRRRDGTKRSTERQPLGNVLSQILSGEVHEGHDRDVGALCRQYAIRSGSARLMSKEAVARGHGEAEVISCLILIAPCPSSFPRTRHSTHPNEVIKDDIVELESKREGHAKGRTV